jgi:hypothetical protein
MGPPVATNSCLKLTHLPWDKPHFSQLNVFTSAQKRTTYQSLLRTELPPQERDSGWYGNLNQKHFLPQPDSLSGIYSLNYRQDISINHQQTR